MASTRLALTPVLNHDLHAIDATPARAHPTHWLIYAQVDADRKLAVPGAFADRVDDERSSRLYLALKRLVEAENLDAIAIRCWPELPRDYGQWPYLAVTRLADEGLPVACEGDVDGALTMLCCKFLGCGAPYISDWLEHDRSSFVCWHGGMCPTCLTSDLGDGGGPRIRPHFNNKKPAVVGVRVRINPVGSP